MKIKPIKEAIMLCRKAHVTPFVWGHRGLGKSQVTAQTATENRLGFSDMRLSQCEASDLRGLPLADKESGRTKFLPPADLPVGGMSWDEFMKKLDLSNALLSTVGEEKTAELLRVDPGLLENPDGVVAILSSLGFHTKADQIAQIKANNTPFLNEGILFLDELNRAQDDVIQAVFQLVLDHRIGTYVLPTGWSVVVAGNYMEGYNTNGFTDPAFLDRFSHLTFDGGETTLEEWVGFMTEKHGGNATNIIEFASQNPKHLDGDVKGEQGFSIQPSRRSWEAVVRVEKAYAAGGFSDDSRMGVIGGLVGKEVAIAYLRYNCPVRPKDLIDHGVEAYRSKLGQISRNQMTGLMWGLASFLKGKVDNDKLAKVAMDFARYLAKEHKDKDIAVAFCNIMVGGSNLKARAALVSNPAVAKLIGKFRGNDVKKTFADRLNEDPQLQQLVSKCAWGSEH